jgi:hyaluronoglucosaminidase
MDDSTPVSRIPHSAFRILNSLLLFLAIPWIVPAEPPPLADLSPLPLKLELKPGPPLRFSSATTLVETRGPVDPVVLQRIRSLQGASKELVLRESMLLGSPESLRAELAALGVAPGDLGTLGPEGYALAVGELPDPDGGAPRAAAVCAATTARGLLHALATLEQASHPDPGAPAGIRARAVPRFAAVDRPAIPLRGVVEGFSGSPWPPAARLAMIPFLARHKMNFFLHAPADDPHVRTQWRDALPRKVLAHLRDLADTCALEQIDFAYGLRPGDTIQYADVEDGRLLAARVDAVRALGVRRFALLFDNLPTDLRYPRDREAFPDLAAAQAAVANRLLGRLRTSDPFATLYFLPTEPWGTGDSPYRRSLRERLDPAVELFWTGQAVVASTLGEAEATAAAGRFGRVPVFWDNYPVNYYSPHRVFLGPVRGRAPEAAERLAGFVSNPMALPEASKIALATAADFAWNPRAYDPARAWASSLAEAAGPDAWAQAALRKLAENAQSSWLQSAESPVLAGLLQAAEEKGATAGLERDLADLAAVRKTLEETPAIAPLAAELAPWTARLSWRCAQSRESIALAAALREGKADAVWARRLAIGAVDRPPGGPGARVAAVEVCGRLLAAVVARRAEEADRWLGIPPPTAVSTSLPAHESFIPRLAADGNALTAFGSARAPAAGDHVTLDLGRLRPVARVELLQGGPEHAEDYLRDGVLEVSPDGRAWQEIGAVAKAEVEVDLPQPLNARFVRARATRPQTAWLRVREFAVAVLDEPTIQTTFPVATGHPGLEAALDRRVETEFASAGPAPAGSHITVDLRAPREVASVAILQDPCAAIPAGRVLLSADGSAWAEAGTLTGAATRLAFEKPRTARFVRVEATAPCNQIVRIHEVGVVW